MASAQDEHCLSPYRKLLADLSFELSGKEVQTLTLVWVDFNPRGTTEKICSGLQFFDVLEQDGRIGPRNLALLLDMFLTIGRVDLVQKIQAFLTVFVNDEADAVSKPPSTTADPPTFSKQFTICDDLVTDGQGDNLPQSHYQEETDWMDETNHHRGNYAPHLGTSQLVRQPLLKSVAGVPQVAFSTRDGGQGVYSDTSSRGKGPSLGLRGPSAPAPSRAQTGQQRGAQAQGSSSGRIKPVGPEPVRYINFLACQGYAVEIVGGKHFKTPEGEFVELKSGTQYKIHVKNTRSYGCSLDISIDGYDVGGWVVDGGKEFTIERSAYEPKKFTFYRVKAAPEEAGIESGRPENGVVKCVFTPVTLKFNEAPSTTAGDLKTRIGHSMETSGRPCETETSTLTQWRKRLEDEKMKFMSGMVEETKVFEQSSYKPWPWGALESLNDSVSQFFRSFANMANRLTTHEQRDECPNMKYDAEEIGRVTEPDPAWRAGATTLQGYSTQQFMTADPVKVDPSRKVELVLRLVAREDEKDLVFPKEECKPLSTLYPPTVPE